MYKCRSSLVWHARVRTFPKQELLALTSTYHSLLKDFIYPSYIPELDALDSYLPLAEALSSRKRDILY